MRPDASFGEDTMRSEYECVCCGEVCEDAVSLRHHEREQHGGRDRRRRRTLAPK